MNNSSNTLLIVALMGVVLYLALKPKPVVSPYAAAGAAVGSIVGGIAPIIGAIF